MIRYFFLFIGAAVFLSFDSTGWVVPPLFAHCDTMGGPVVQAAREALKTGDVRHALV